jgi:phosphate transport system protein
MKQFEDQLDKLRKRIIKMSSLVDEQLDLAIRAVYEEKPELAKLAMEMDDKVDKFDLKIEKQCQKIIALNQPVAMDLRVIISALTINTNLERIGDNATNVAENFLLFSKKPHFFDRTRFGEMSNKVKDMVRKSIDSYIDNDSKLAENVIRTDNIIDDLNIENHRVLIEIMKEDPNNIEEAVAQLVISRHLERAGDHATNIAEDIIFIVEANLIKHKYEKYIFSDEEDEDDDIS